MILYRPVGTAELELITESGFTRFPPRLPEQPIFYPVLNERYAREIAERWNAGGLPDRRGMTGMRPVSRCRLSGAAIIRNYGCPPGSLTSSTGISQG